MAVWEQVTPVCGNFTANDDPEQGFVVHYYCGIGWPESVVMNSSMARYCVEHQLANDPNDANLGFAPYISCNSDETDYFGNAPRDPTCICWVRSQRFTPHIYGRTVAA